VPVGRVERSSVHPNQYIIGPDLWQADIGQLQDVRRPEPVLDNSPHRSGLRSSPHAMVIEY